METFNELKDSFYRNRNINPYTGAKIQIGKKTYQKLVEEFGDPQVITEVNISKQEIPSDVLFQILLYADGDDLENLCSVSKASKSVCDRKDFWKTKFVLENIPIMDVNKLSLSEYRKMIGIIVEVNEIFCLLKHYLDYITIGKYDKSITLKLIKGKDLYHYETRDYDMKITTIEVQSLLIDMLYHHPNLSIHSFFNRDYDDGYNVELRRKHINKIKNKPGKIRAADVMIRLYERMETEGKC